MTVSSLYKREKKWQEEVSVQEMAFYSVNIECKIVELQRVFGQISKFVFL